MKAMMNKKITLIMDNDNIDNIKTIKEFTPISGFIVQILYPPYHQDHKSDEFLYIMMKKMIL